MTPDEMERLVEEMRNARRIDERKIAALEGELRTEKAKRGAAETMREQTLAEVRTDRATARIAAELTKAGAPADAAASAAYLILSRGDPEYDAAGELASVAVNGQRATKFDKIAGRAFETIGWLAQSAGMPLPAAGADKAPRAGKAGLEGIEGADKNLLTMNMKDMTDRVGKRIQALRGDGLPPPARRMTEDELLNGPLSDLNKSVADRIARHGEGKE